MRRREDSTPAAGTAVKDDLSLRAELSATKHSLVVQTLVRTTEVDRFL